MAINQIATLGVKVDPRGAVTGSKRAKNAITGIGKAASGVKSRILSLQGALLGLGAGALVKSIITTASSVESLKVRLQFLTKSGEEATQAFKDMNTFAAKVPFSLEEIERASPLLLTVAKDASELNELLAITGDIAAVSGLSFEATAGQLQRAMAGGISAADLFRERGVKAFLGFEEGVQFSAEQTKQKIQAMWRDGTTTAVGATEELAKTFVGQVSMMQDAFRELKLAVADAGVFGKAGETIKKITEIFRSKEAIANMKKFGETITSIGDVMAKVFNAFMAMPAWIRDIGIIMAFLGGKKARLIIAGLTAVVVGIREISEAVKDFQNIANKANKLEEQIAADTTAFEELNDIIRHTKDEIKKYQDLRSASEQPFSGTGSNMFGVLEERELMFLTIALRNLEEQQRQFGLIIKTNLETLKSYDLVDIPTLGENVNTEIMMADGAIKRLTRQKVVVEKLVDTYQNLSHNAHQALSAIDIMSAKLIKPENGLHGMLDVVDDLRISFDASIHPTEIMGLKFDELAAKAKEAQEKIKEFADGLASSIEGSIMKMVQGLMSFKDVVKSVFQFVAQEMIKMNIAQPMASALSGIISGAFGGAVTGTGNPHMNSGGGFGDFLKNLFRADGGSVTAGQPYIVGERGAELFTPNSSGMITPNDKMGGQTINVTYSPQVNALDPRQAQSVIAENAPTIVAVVRQAFNQNGQQVAI